MTQNLVLIGPTAVGKSTLGRLLAAQLGAPHCSLDDARWDYFNEIGFDTEEQQRRWETGGMDGVLRYWQPFEVHAVERVLADYQDAVIDFGGGYTIQDDPQLYARVERALAPHHVVLLLPSTDFDRSVHILGKRTAGIFPDTFNLRQHIARHRATAPLAKLVVDTEGMAPEAVRDHILAELARPTSSAGL